MNRPPITARPLLPLALAALVFGIAAPSRGFTLLESPVNKMSAGAPAPADAPSDMSTRPRYSVSDDGCWIVFVSSARSLLSSQNDSNGTSDVFLYDACTSFKVVAIVSHRNGQPLVASNGKSDQPVITPDGNYVVFRSSASDIVEGAGFGGQTNIFFWDRAADTFQLVSHANGSTTTAGDGDSSNAVVARTKSGRPKVAFETLARNIDGGDFNGFSDIYIYNAAAPNNNTVRVSRPSDPLGSDTDADGGSFNPVIDSTGTCVAFESAATNLVSDKANGDDKNNALDVFSWRIEPGVVLISHKTGAPNLGLGATTANAASSEPSIADDCARVAFKSAADDLASGLTDKNGANDVFFALTDGSDAKLVSHTAANDAVTGNGASDAPILSRDGSWVAYASQSSDLVDSQSDSALPSWDVFVQDLSGGKNVLVSHHWKDAAAVAGGDSVAPEISTDGLYVAYVSPATVLDRNQNDGNGTPDVFLYNSRWNTSIMASPRFASLAIAGDKDSFHPALSGDGLTVAYTSRSGNIVAEDPETGGLEDTFFFRPYTFFPFMSARSTDTTNVLQWVTPPVDYAGMELWVNSGSTCPTIYSGAGSFLSAVSPAANTIATFTDPATYSPGTNLCYSIFAATDATPIQAGTAPARTLIVRTLNAAPSGPAKWATALTSVAALAQVGIGAQNVVAVANDGGVFGLARGSSGGQWSSAHRPFRVDFSPIQGRPPVLSMSVMGSARTTFVGSQDGRVYAFDADRGAGEGAGGALWYTTPALGTTVQPGVAGMFAAFGGVGDHLLVGARTGTSAFYALDPSSGATRSGTFTGGGNPFGTISTTASVDYTLKQVYFASTEFTAGAPSLWCLKLTASGLNGACWTPLSGLGGISGGPIERSGVVYVGTDFGQVHAIVASTGAAAWPGPFTGCGGGNAIKSFVLADRLGTGKDLYYATSSALCALTDSGGSVSLKWQISTIPGPSVPLLARIGGVAYVYVGATDGRLYQIEAENPANIKWVQLRAAVDTIGAAAFDGRDDMLYVGSAAGAIYAVQAPLLP